MIWGLAFIVTVIVAVILIDVLLHLSVARMAMPMFENKPPLDAEELPPHPDAELIEFPTTHGLILRGSIWKQEHQDPKGLIVFCHEYGGNHGTARAYCQGLHEAGFDIFAFDFRNQGESDFQQDYEPLHWLSDFEVNDVQAALGYIDSRLDLNSLPIGLFGISRGAVAALAASALSPEVESIACESGYSTHSLLWHHYHRWASLIAPNWLIKVIPDWHVHISLNAIRCLSQYNRRCRFTRLEKLLPLLRDRNLFLISGLRDNYVVPEITQELSKSIGGNQQEVWFVEGAKHNMARHADAEEYDDRLVAFFTESLAIPSTVPQKSLVSTP